MSNSITFLNMSGDVTITWDDSNREEMLELIRKKMKDGLKFYEIKEVPLIKVQYKKKLVSEKRLTEINSVSVKDADAAKLFGDSDIHAAVEKGVATPARLKGDATVHETTKRLDTAEEVVKTNSVAVKPIKGG